MIVLPDLPYKNLNPFLSADTLKFHHGKHHKAYVDKLNMLLEKADFPADFFPSSITQDEILKKLIKTQTGPIFNNAGQVYNHSFYWHCLGPLANHIENNLITQPSEKLISILSDSFGSMDAFKQQFVQCGMDHFGSGWVWLVLDESNHLHIESTSNADCPIRTNKKPLLTCDVWEHAYYLDYQNNRKSYLEKFFNFVNWRFVEAQYPF